LLSGIIFMILYSTAAYSIVNAAITAIDDFPLKAVTWIGGGQGVDTNHDIKGSTLGAMAFVGNSAIQSGIKSIQGATSSMAQAPTQQAALNTTAQRDHDSGLVAPNSSGAVTAGQATGPQPSAGSIGQSGRTQPTNGGGGSNMTASNAAPSIKDKPNTSPTIIQPTNAGGGARTPAQQATMEAHRDGRQFSSLNDKPANNGGASLNSTPFGQGRINPAAANSIRSAAATSAAIPTGKAGFQHAVDAARAAGHPKPELAAAQWALESNWGRKVSGDNNYFGIKDFSGGGKTVGTHEVVGGKTVAVNAAFRNYATPQDAFKGLSNLMDKPRYAGVEAAGSLADAAHAIQKGGYATDPEYANKLIQTMRANGVDVGRSTTLASAAPSGIAPQVAEATAPAAESGSGMASTVAHTVLGGLSLIPGLNIVTSGADALLYTAEGDYGNAALSTASMIPGVKWGVVGAKGFKLMRGASKVATVTGKLAREEKLANLVGGGSGGDSGGGGGRPAPVADAPDDSAALAYIAASNRKKSAAHAYGIEDTGAAPQIIVPTSSGGGPRSASRQAAMEALREK